MYIGIESEIIKGMAGEVKYHTRPCPNGENGMGNVIAKVGSVACQMCRHFGGIEEHRTDGGEIVAECVICNHDKA